MKKVVLSCVFSIISFANVFGMIPPEEKSVVSEKSPVSSEALFSSEDMTAIKTFSDFLKENADEELDIIRYDLKDLFLKLETPLQHLVSLENNKANDEIIFKALAPLFCNMLETKETFDLVDQISFECAGKIKIGTPLVSLLPRFFQIIRDKLEGKSIGYRCSLDTSERSLQSKFNKSYVVPSVEFFMCYNHLNRLPNILKQIM